MVRKKQLHYWRYRHMAGQRSTTRLLVGDGPSTPFLCLTNVSSDPLPHCQSGRCAEPPSPTSALPLAVVQLVRVLGPVQGCRCRQLLAISIEALGITPLGSKEARITQGQPSVIRSSGSMNVSTSLRYLGLGRGHGRPLCHCETSPEFPLSWNTTRSPAASLPFLSTSRSSSWSDRCCITVCVPTQPKTSGEPCRPKMAAMLAYVRQWYLCCDAKKQLDVQ